MSENTNQRKTITGDKVVQRYTSITGFVSLILTIPIFSIVVFLSALGGSFAIEDLFIFSLIQFIPSLLVMLVTAQIIRNRYYFQFDRVFLLKKALLRGAVDFFIYILVPVFLFFVVDASSYHSISISTFVLLIASYYCIGFYAFRKKTGVEAIEKNKS